MSWSDTAVEAKMRVITLSAAMLVAALASAAPAQAKGCIKGALVGGTAGHFVGHHGFLGAMAGCAIGHHRAAKRERNYDAGSRSGYGSSSAPEQVPAHRY